MNESRKTTLSVTETLPGAETEMEALYVAPATAGARWRSRPVPGESVRAADEPESAVDDCAADMPVTFQFAGAPLSQSSKSAF